MSNLNYLRQKYPTKSLLKKKEAAMEMNCSIATLDRLRKQNIISSKKVGGGIYFTFEEIASFLDS
ncbi:MerR family transcriptional regulator [Arcobacter peruensis]|uniref:helix-turn-helix domain-containing protein n=1 Tax=Arcobacter peruensis TaxID=2320140 RepID=UPI000F073E4A|nr:helix-turn-helix domain-containing protein [Arcobacter peruensis]